MSLASILFWLNIFTGVANCKYSHIDNTESKNIHKNEQNFKLCNFLKEDNKNQGRRKYSQDLTLLLISICIFFFLIAQKH